MSDETMSWLERNVKVGFVSKDGRWPWHASKDAKIDGKRLYAGAIPAADVSELLNRVQPVKADARFAYTDADGKRQSVKDESRCGIVDAATGNVLGTASAGYEIHGYVEWGQQRMSNIVGDSLSAASVGLLRQGARAFVTFETENTRKTAMGIDYRPFIAFLTSLDGSWASTYKLMHTLIVCDNTAAIGLSENSRQIKRRHTKHSQNFDSLEAKEALGLLDEYDTALESELETLCNTPVTDQQWGRFKDLYVPIPNDDGRGKTVAENKHDSLSALYSNDPRCAPWAGTAFGVVQTVNTYNAHIAGVRGGQDEFGDDKTALRFERKMNDALGGKVESADADALTILERALATA